MTNAPERIWIEDEFGEGDDDQWTYGTWDVRNYAGYTVEYVRADRVEQLERELSISRMAQVVMDNGAKALTAERDKYEGAWMTAEGKLADTKAARDRLREALKDIVADCEVDYPPSHGAIKYAAKLALKGETP